MVAVVSRNRIDSHPKNIGEASIAETNRLGAGNRVERIVNQGRGNNNCVGRSQRRDLSITEMITMVMADQNQIGFGQSHISALVLRIIIRIVVDDLSIPGHDEGGMIKRM